MNVALSNASMRTKIHKANAKGEDVVFVVIDSGVNEVGSLKGRVTHGFTDYYEEQLLPDGHGTFVASQLLEWCPEAHILSYCVFPKGEGSTLRVNKALKDLLERVKIDSAKQYIVNMSLSCNLKSNILSTACDSMHTLISKLVANNVPIFVAAGNDGSEQLYAYPSCFEEPICVSAVNSFGQHASFSTWHNEVDFADIGVGVSGLSPQGVPITFSGTSMACPNVAGKCGLLASRIHSVTDRWASEEELFLYLKSYCEDVGDVGFDKKTGHGVVDLRKAAKTFALADEEPIAYTVYNGFQRLAEKLKNVDLMGFIRKLSSASTQFTRNLKYKMVGEDVWYIKGLLFNMGGYYDEDLKAVTNKKFGGDTRTAVKKFQSKNVDENGQKLVVDGIVGRLTWNAIVRVALGGATQTTPVVETAPIVLPEFTGEFPAHIGSAAIAAMKPALAEVSSIRQQMVLQALQFAVDPDKNKTILSFYIRGGNIYNTDLKPNVMTKSRLTSYFKRTKYAQYFDGGRKEMMIAASEKTGYTNTGADCSGGVVGLLRYFKLRTTGFDATANTLCSDKYSSAVSKADLKAGDFIGRDGHIGLYCGGGYIVEWLGGAYGCALTKISPRSAYNFVDKKMHKFSAWTKFRKPRFY